MTDVDEMAIAQLREFVQIPSHSRDPEARRAAAQFSANLLEAAGFEVCLHGRQDAPNVIANIGGNPGSGLLFYNHYDVVPPGEEKDWRHPPFAAVIEEGVLHGRGTSDHKASFIARLAAIRDLRERGALAIPVSFLIDGEEEVGSPGLEQTILENKTRLAAVGGLYSGGARSENGSMVIRAGCKGRCGLRLSVTLSDRNHHSKWAAMLRNPAWRLIAALGTLYDGREDIVLVDRVLDGIAGPDARDEEALQRLKFDVPEFLREVGHEALRADAAADPIRSLMFAPTFNLAWIKSGTGAGTVLPGCASAMLDIRLVPGQSSSAVAREIRTHLARHGFGDVIVEEAGGSEPDKCSLDDAVLCALVEAAEALRMNCVLHPMGAGSGPRHLFRRHLGYSLIQDPGCSWQGSNDHAANENIFVEHFLENRRLIETFLVHAGQSAPVAMAGTAA